MNNNPFLFILNVAWYLIKIGIRARAAKKNRKKILMVTWP